MRSAALHAFAQANRHLSPRLLREGFTRWVRNGGAGEFIINCRKPRRMGGADALTKPIAVRDPLADHLLTPQNCALLIIDYQPLQVASIGSMDRRSLVENIVSVAKLGRLFDLPIVLSTVNVQAQRLEPTIPPLKQVLSDVPEIDRTTINAWEDPTFKNAVLRTKRRKLIITGLWTEACLTFPTLDALREGFDVFIIVDAVGGTSPEAHRAAIQRLIQAGAKPTSWVQLACELQRDWSRTMTVKEVAELVLKVQGK
jgi:nicotinamidase-related amidase